MFQYNLGQLGVFPSFGKKDFGLIVESGDPECRCSLLGTIALFDNLQSHITHSGTALSFSLDEVNRRCFYVPRFVSLCLQKLKQIFGYHCLLYIVILLIGSKVSSRQSHHFCHIVYQVLSKYLLARPTILSSMIRQILAHIESNSTWSECSVLSSTAHIFWALAHSLMHLFHEM